MAISLPSIVARIELDDSELDAGTAKLGGIGKAAAAGLAVAGAAAVAVGVKGTQAAAEVEKGLAEVLTLNSGIEAGSAEAGAALDGLKGNVADLSSEVGVAQDELVNGLYQAISAGVPEDNAFEFLETASKFAVAGVTDVETAVDGISTAINAYGLEASDADAVAASFFTGIQDGKTNAEELSNSLFQVAPAAGAAGVELGETVAALSTLTASGTPTAVATTQVRQAINELADSGSAVGQKFEEVAGTSFREFTEGGGTLQEALMLLQEEAEGTGDVIGDYFGSVEASAAATSLATTGADTFADALDNQAAAAEDSAGVIDNAYQKIDDTTARSFERVKIEGQNALISVGETLTPIAGELADRLVPAIAGAAEGFQTFVDYAMGAEPIPGYVTAIATVVGAVLIPVFLRAGVTMATSWLMGTVGAMRAAATHLIASYRIVGGWVMQGAAALRNLPFVIRYYVTLGAQAMMGAARAVGAGIAIVGSWLRQAAVATASGARMALAWVVGIIAPAAGAAATMVATATRVALAWIRMGVQALLQAGRMALAWVIAMGPVGWVIAAVIGLVVLIIANWDRIVAFTRSMATRVATWLGNMRDRAVAAVGRMRERVQAFVQSMRDRAQAAVASMRERVVSFVSGMRDRVVAFVGAMRDRAVAFVLVMVARALSAVGNMYRRAVAFVGNMRDRVTSAVGSMRDRAVRFVTVMRTRVTMLVQAMRVRAQQTVQAMRDRIVSAITGLRDRAVSAVTSLRDRFVQAFTTARQRAVAAMTLARTLVTNAVNRMRTAVVERVNRIRQLFSELPGRIRTALGNAGEMLRGFGRRIIGGLIGGITSRISDVGSAMSRVASRITGFLPSSPAKEGPLRRNPPEVSGGKIATGVAAGIEARVREVVAASASMAEAAVLDDELGAEAVAGVRPFGRARRRTTTSSEQRRGMGAGVNIEAVNVQRADPFEVADELAWRVRTSHA